MSYGFDYKKYYVITSISVHHTQRNSCIGFIKYPDSEDKELQRHKHDIQAESKRVEELTGAKFCHLYFYKSSLPFRFILVFDLGLNDKNIINKMKLKAPNMVNSIRADDNDYISKLKDDYEKNEVYHHEGYTAFID